MKRIYRFSSDKKVAGVCVGLGEFFGMEPVLFRIVFVILSAVSGVGLLAYIVMWFLIPEGRGQDVTQKVYGRLYLSVNDRKLAGVCGGLGECFNLDPVFFRIFFILSAFVFGIGVLFYALLWLIIPVKQCVKFAQPKEPVMEER